VGVGRIIDEQLLNDLPHKVDPCGENGEFHTVVFDDPILKNPIQFEIDEIIYREYKRPKDEKHSQTTISKNIYGVLVL